VRRLDHAPEERPAPVLGPLTDVIDRAAASGCTPYLDLAAAAGAGRELWDAECESWIELPPDVPRGRYVALAISGESMDPLMHPGDIVLVKLGPTVVGGTVIVARRPDEGYVVKRVGKIRRTGVELLSLNPDFPPLLIPRREHLIVGTVLLRWCAHGGGKGEAGSGKHDVSSG
jgi:SOS-response transcriptional repressor LexA